jgi:peptide/nickel transport system substrate-binding protein
VLTFWNPSGVETDQWAQASVRRVAKRIHWTPDPALMKTVDAAAAEPDTTKRSALYLEYEKALLDQASYLILFQPIYQFAVRATLKTFPLTAAGWEAELYQATT